MKITDLKYAVIGNNPVVRITTDDGIHGLWEVEHATPYLKPHILFHKFAATLVWGGANAAPTPAESHHTSFADGRYEVKRFPGEGQWRSRWRLIG